MIAIAARVVITTATTSDEVRRFSGGCINLEIQNSTAMMGRLITTMGTLTRTIDSMSISGTDIENLFSHTPDERDALKIFFT
ncbi:hypothetical protein KSF_008170 [Reticulibacter mediterranei]|uniref:Uncharacterized protein n=1 Tax=Reticulibacter mediterranei TaxID=2778369 RepID=A0A8J3IGG1_9CHLR|nr:hypothetical protein KSF_008170 [Reticulibacter mediterranei]